MRTTKQRTIPGGAGRLADRVYRLCLAGLDRRTQRECAEPGITRAVHEKRGHDAGCDVLGIPLRSVRHNAKMWDEADAAGLVLEAIEEVVAQCVDAREEWTRAQVSEWLLYALSRRIRWKR